MSRRHHFAERTWADIAALDKSRLLALLPVGATEAHGPHLPLSTDVLIAEAMAEAGAERLAAAGWEPWILPPFAYTAARFAEGFPGTLSMRPETVTALLVDVAAALTWLGARALVIANSHLDPTHLASLYTGIERAEAEKLLPIVFPDITRKPWALRLSEEFRSGACHAGRYEGSVVMAVAPELVREDIRLGLAANPASLSTAIRDGKKSFEEAGGPRAYFGAPAESSAEEGAATIAVLGEIVAEAVAQNLAS